MTAIIDALLGLILDPSGLPIQNATSINSGYLYGNRVINGAQEIDQVNQGAAVTPTTDPFYLTDMFGGSLSVASKLTYQQVVDAPAGLKNSLKVTVASQYSPVATDYFLLKTHIEGKDVIDFQLGTSGAATFTLSNWIKGSVPGTYAVTLRNGALNRSYVGTVAVTTSWAPVKITVTGDLTGTWATDNTTGLILSWDLGSGSNYQTVAGAWQAGNYLRTAGSVTFVNQIAGSTLNITGVDCRLGSVAPSYFERRANESQLVKRYVQWCPFNQNFYPTVASQALESTVMWAEMRATPSAAPIVADPNSSQTTNNNASNLIQRLTPYGGSATLTGISATNTFVIGYRSLLTARLF